MQECLLKHGGWLNHVQSWGRHRTTKQLYFSDFRSPVLKLSIFSDGFRNLLPFSSRTECRVGRTLKPAGWDHPAKPQSDPPDLKLCGLLRIGGWRDVLLLRCGGLSIFPRQREIIGWSQEWLKTFERSKGCRILAHYLISCQSFLRPWRSQLVPNSDQLHTISCMLAIWWLPYLSIFVTCPRPNQDS